MIRIRTINLSCLLNGVRTLPSQSAIFDQKKPIQLLCVGNVELIRKTCVAVVGGQHVSTFAGVCARLLGKKLSDLGIVVVSDMAEGINSVVLRAAILAGGAVIGLSSTSIKFAPKESYTGLYREISDNHLLLSFADNKKTATKRDYVRSSRLLAVLSDETIVVEESDSAIHQAIECVRCGRGLWLTKSVAESSKSVFRFGLNDYADLRVLSFVNDLDSHFLGKAR